MIEHLDALKTETPVIDLRRLDRAWFAWMVWRFFSPEEALMRLKEHKSDLFPSKALMTVPEETIRESIARWEAIPDDERVYWVLSADAILSNLVSGCGGTVRAIGAVKEEGNE